MTISLGEVDNLYLVITLGEEARFGGIREKRKHCVRRSRQAQPDRLPNQSQAWACDGGGGDSDETYAAPRPSATGRGGVRGRAGGAGRIRRRKPRLDSLAGGRRGALLDGGEERRGAGDLF